MLFRSETRQPMAIARAAAIGRHSGDSNMGRIERRAERFNERALAPAFGSFDDNDQSFLVDDLCQLGAGETMLQRRQRSGNIALVRVAPFKFC